MPGVCLVEFYGSFRTTLSGLQLAVPSPPSSSCVAGEIAINSTLLIDLEKKAAESFLCAERNSV